MQHTQDMRLGEFLRARRARVRPADVGLPQAGRRRVPGLRREELALLAGVGVSYYTRLEQGQAHNASAAVQDAIARVLGLDEHERAHLARLAGPARRTGGGRDSAPEQVLPATRELLRAVGEVPAVVAGRRADVLAWNDLGHALLAGHLDPTSPERPADRPNLARLLFLDPHGRDLYVDWRRKARAMVSNLRLLAGQYPEDARLAALIGELSIGSREFAALWADHRVSPCEGDVYELRHPVVGLLTVTQQSLLLPRAPGQTLTLITTAADSTSQHAMTLLAQTRGPHPSAPRTRPLPDTRPLPEPRPSSALAPRPPARGKATAPTRGTATTATRTVTGPTATAPARSTTSSARSTTTAATSPARRKAAAPTRTTAGEAPAGELAPCRTPSG